MHQKTGILHLRRGREKPVVNRHPWVFSGAIHRVEGTPQAGELVDVLDSSGRWLATAYFNQNSQIRGRILSWQEGEVIDEDFWRRKLERAILGRQLLPLHPHTDAYRVVNTEADGVPGLIVDKYGDYLVLQAMTLGIDLRKQELANLLQEMLQPKGIIERSQGLMRRKEGLQDVAAILTGQAPPELITIHENGFPFGVNLLDGQKTGFYLDQRENRAILGQPYLMAGKEVLNMFAYTGGFAVYGAVAGAKSIINVDVSAEALTMAEHNMLTAVGERPQDEYLLGDAFAVLREYRDTGRQFDVVILDPPKFVQTSQEIDRATRGYKDINWLGMRILRPGGILATFSCSGLVSADLFQKVVFGAAVDAGRDVQILQHLWQSADHPISLTVPESAYLKGFLCRVW